VDARRVEARHVRRFRFAVRRQPYRLPIEEFVLGVDLDGVVGDFYAAMRVVAAEWLGKDINELTTDVTFGLPEWGLTPERYPDMHRFAVTERGLFEQMELIDGAGPALRRLSDEGVYIRIITHRLFISHFHEPAVQQTVRWLDHYGIPYRDLCLIGEKVAVGADLYIEDSPQNVEALRKVKPTIVFTNSTNRALDPPRADSWDEAEQQVLHTKYEWEQGREGTQLSITGN
jgi:5'(3')-deoxyribonucleotidase